VDEGAISSTSIAGLTEFSHGAVSCEINRLSCGGYKGQKVCLVIFEFSFLRDFKIVSGSVSLNFRARYGETQILRMYPRERNNKMVASLTLTLDVGKSSSS
jgi:hypothetical protein